MLYRETFSLAFTLRILCTVLALKDTHNTHLTLAHTHAMKRVFFSTSTLTVPASTESTVLSTLPTGTALHLLLSHWHNKRNTARSTKPERLREQGRSTETEREIKLKQKRDRRRDGNRENWNWSWSYQVHRCISEILCFLLFISALSPPFSCLERIFFLTRDLSYFSSPDVQYRQIRQEMMVASSSVLAERR